MAGLASLDAALLLLASLWMRSALTLVVATLFASVLERLARPAAVWTPKSSPLAAAVIRTPMFCRSRAALAT